MDGVLDQYLTNPAFQSGVIPFALGLACALLGRKLGWVWAGLGFALAFAALIHLTIGWQFEPLTSQRKFVIAVLAAAAIGLLLDIFLRRAGVLNYVLAIIGAGMAIWFVLPVLQRQEGQGWYLMAGAVSGYVAWLVWWTSHLSERDALPATAALVALGAGTGAVALFGATGFYSQVGFVIAASAGAVALVALFTPGLGCGRSLFLAAGGAAALAGIGAAIYAKAPWYALLPLLAVPMLGHLPMPQRIPRWIHGGIVFLLCSGCAAGAGYLTYRVEGAPM